MSKAFLSAFGPKDSNPLAESAEEQYPRQKICGNRCKRDQNPTKRLISRKAGKSRNHCPWDREQDCRRNRQPNSRAQSPTVSGAIRKRIKDIRE